MHLWEVKQSCENMSHSKLFLANNVAMAKKPSLRVQKPLEMYMGSTGPRHLGLEKPSDSSRSKLIEGQRQLATSK